MKKARRPYPSNKCQVCGEMFVVDSLAECCELKHSGVVFVRTDKQQPRKKPDLKVVDDKAA